MINSTQLAFLSVEILDPKNISNLAFSYWSFPGMFDCTRAAENSDIGYFLIDLNEFNRNGNYVHFNVKQLFLKYAPIVITKGIYQDQNYHRDDFFVVDKLKSRISDITKGPCIDHLHQFSSLFVSDSENNYSYSAITYITIGELWNRNTANTR